MVDSLTQRSRSRLFQIGLCLALSLGACQTSRFKEFETVRGGMSKSDVIELVGGPQRTQRWHGRDRWEYRFYGTSEGELIREVHFENGKSTYVGPAIKPAVSAEEQDRRNETYNREAEAAEVEALSRDRDGITIQKFRPVTDESDSLPVQLEPATGAKPSTSQ